MDIAPITSFYREWKGNGIYIHEYSRCTFRVFAYFIGRNLYLFRIQLCFCEPCHTTGTTQNRALYYLCLSFVNCSCQQRLQIEVLNFNNICIVLVEFLWKIQRGLLKYNSVFTDKPLRTPTKPRSRLQRFRDALKLPVDRYACHELGKVLERELGGMSIIIIAIIIIIIIIIIM